MTNLIHEVFFIFLIGTKKDYQYNILIYKLLLKVNYERDSF